MLDIAISAVGRSARCRISRVSWYAWCLVEIAGKLQARLYRDAALGMRLEVAGKTVVAGRQPRNADDDADAAMAKAKQMVGREPPRLDIVGLDDVVRQALDEHVEQHRRHT